MGGVYLQVLGQHEDLGADGVVAKRAMTKASPRVAAVTRPSGLIGAELSLFVRNTARVRHVAVGAVGVLGPGGELLRRPFAFEHAPCADRARTPTTGGHVGRVVGQRRPRASATASGSTRSSARTACRRCAARCRGLLAAAGFPAARPG